MKGLLSCMTAGFVALSAAPAGAEPDSGRALAIVAPGAERTILEGSTVEISFAPTPALGEGEAIVLLVDDQIVVIPSGLTKFALTGVPSGTHVLEAIIVDADVNPVAAAEAVTHPAETTRRICSTRRRLPRHHRPH